MDTAHKNPRQVIYRQTTTTSFLRKPCYHSCKNQFRLHFHCHVFHSLNTTYFFVVYVRTFQLHPRYWSLYHSPELWVCSVCLNFSYQFTVILCVKIVILATSSNPNLPIPRTASNKEFVKFTVGAMWCLIYTDITNVGRLKCHPFLWALFYTGKSLWSETSNANTRKNRIL
jgi:hypothetical protein